MSVLKWYQNFIIGAFCGLALVACFNMGTDPFGVFGDKILQWPGYNFTNNPRIAKIEYVRHNQEKYDSYIIGSSKTSSISPTLLNKYYGDANFYNMMVYGADLYNMEQLLYYLGDNLTVKNFVLNLGLSELMSYDVKQDDIKQITNAKVAKTPLIPFYTKLLFNDPKYGIEKVQSYLGRPYLPFYKLNDAFIPELGNYNKSVRDEENIVNIFDYKNQIGDGTFFETSGRIGSMSVMEKCIDSLRRIKAYCDDKNINLLIVSSPNYEGELYGYDMDVIREYWTQLAEISEFWVFSGYNSYSDDPRYFYDKLHYRNMLGDMMLAKIWNDTTAYVHDDYGHLVNKDNVAQVMEEVLTPNTQTATLNENPLIPVPILMYHHFVEDGEEVNSVTKEISRFTADMEALKAAGYTPLFFSDLIEYVNGDEDIVLPEKPIVITMDDGYLSNYELAFPVLEQLNMKATVFMIGWSTGQTTRLDGTAITPHFSIEQAALMKESDIIDLQSHSYDFHELQSQGFQRDGLLRIEGETERDYFEAFKQDVKKFNELFLNNLGERAKIISYPYGFADLLSDQIAKDLGFEATVLTGDKISYIQKGNPQSLYGLYRITVYNEMEPQEIINLIEYLK